uniref:MLO-like protein n=1 Tax=Macrostomum lignano TaxID=282301 RepID=A0A1I8I8N8_9PLAT
AIRLQFETAILLSLHPLLSHLRAQRFDRVYKCESDLSRCQNEIRLTALELAQVQAQRSSESHDSTVSAASMASAASYGGRTRWSGAEGAEGYSMDLLNMRRDDEDDEDGEDRKDEASIKGLWKRAFSSLKIRDRIKSPKKKKGSKDEEDDIDPVYYLLKHAADKGTQRCPACSQQQPTTSSGASA